MRIKTKSLALPGKLKNLICVVLVHGFVKEEESNSRKLRRISNMKPNNLSYIHDRISQVKVINTHEHLWDESWRLENKGDWTGQFYHYGVTALRMARMSESESKELFSQNSGHERKWEIFSKYFNISKNSAYIQAPVIAIKDIYGVDSINIDSMKELSSKIEKMIQPGFYRQILREKAGIDFCMVNCFDRDKNNIRFPVRFWGDTEMMKPDLFADGFIFPSDKDLIKAETCMDISTLGDWLRAIDVYFEKYASMCCSIKIALAYSGALNFSPSVSFKTAEEYFQNQLNGKLSYYSEMRPLVDYLFYYIVQKASEYKLPLKFHTGIYSAANFVNFDAIKNNVRDLTKIALAHPECKFIAMHIAYPYQDELVMAIKQVQNLYADMSWSWIVDPYSASDFLKKALTAAPVTKIMGFGGDYSIPENTYGHLKIARRAMAVALSELVQGGYLDLDEAVFVGTYLLRNSALRVYNKE